MRKPRWLWGAAMATLCMTSLASPALALPRPRESAVQRWQARHEARSRAAAPFVRSPRVAAAFAPAGASALSGTGAIAGTVSTAQAGGADAPVAGVEVCAFTFVEGLFGGCGETGSTGAYEVAGLPAGEYAVEFFPAASPRLLAQFYDGVAREAEAQPVTVAEGAVTENINAHLFEGGTITGTVTGGKGAPLAGIEVCAEALTGPLAERCANSEADGTYEIVGLASGEYAVEFGASGELDYATEFYDGTPEGTPDRNKGLPVAVSAGADTPRIDANMHVGASVEGTVSSAATKAGLGGIAVCAFDPKKLVGQCARTRADGSYVIHSLPTGKDEVAFTARFQRGLNYADQFYDGRERPEQADLLAVTEGGTRTGIDAALSEGGRIEGVVTSAVTGLPLEGAEACAFASDPGLGLRCESADAQGRYEIVGLSSEAYVVAFFGPGGGEYQTQYFDGASSAEGATALAVQAGQASSGIDAALKLRLPSALSAPTIAGRAVEGQTLTVTHASWSGGPTSYLDEWGRCAGSQIETCRTVAAGPSYTLGSADVGETIVVREAAVNAGGQSPYVYSAPTEIVVMAARESRPPSGGGGPSAGRPPAQGVGGSSVSLPSVAQLGALLRRLLAPVGRGAKIGALLRHGGYSLAFTALAPGQVTISWCLVGKGAHPTLVAVGHTRFTNAGAARLRVALTARGRGLLRRARRLKVTAKGVLSAVGQGPAGASRGFTLVR